MSLPPRHWRAFPLRCHIVQSADERPFFVFVRLATLSGGLDAPTSISWPEGMPSFDAALDLASCAILVSASKPEIALLLFCHQLAWLN